MNLEIIANHNPADEEVNLLLRGLDAHAKLSTHHESMQPFAYFIREEDTGKLRGGVKGLVFYGCLYTDLLWVDPAIRSEGWGTELMTAAEEFGRQHRAAFATVNTMDWEALSFYQRLGYQIEFVREGFHHHSKMYFLRKPL